MPLRRPAIASRLAFALLAAALLSPAASADGKGFVRTVQNVPTPDQRIAIVFDGTHQTLIVDTTLATPEKEAAWIVPVPGEPEIEAVSTGFFPTLDVVFGARVQTRHTYYFSTIGLLVLALCAASFLPSAWFRAAIIAPIVLVLVVVLLAPALGRASSQPITVEGASVLSQHRVGAFETALLRGESGAAVLEWLRKAGYLAPPAVEPVLDAYCRDGWVFAAAKLAAAPAEPKTATSLRPHPLAFRFKTDRAVYPLRLTGVQNQPCDVRVWVFGQRQAEIEGLRARRCFAVRGTDGSPAQPGAERAVYHSGVRARIGETPIATVLEGQLTPLQMSRDAWVSWRDFDSGFDPAVFTQESAQRRAIDIGIGLLALGAAITLAGRREQRIALRRLGVTLCVAALTVGPLVYALSERVETRRVSIHRQEYHIISEAIDRAKAATGPNAGWDERIAALHAEVAQSRAEFVDHYGPYSNENDLTEGDGPGQYRLVRDGDRLKVLVYSSIGRESEIEWE